MWSARPTTSWRAARPEPSRRRTTTSFVACLPKDILVGGAKAAGRTDVRVSWPKAKLVDYFLAHVPFEVAAEHCGAAKFIALDDVRPLEFLLYLYFGKTEQDLKNFALRDLGIMRTNKATSFKARFTDGDEARACFHYSRLLDRLEVKSASIYQGAVGDIFGGPDCPSDYAADLRSRAACQVGQFFEKLGEKDLARQLYRVGSSPECHERLVRLLYGAGDKADAEDLLRRMIDDPASDDELVFATDFYARKFGGRRTGSCTELLRAGRHADRRRHLSRQSGGGRRRRDAPQGLPGLLRGEHALAFAVRVAVLGRAVRVRPS